MTAERVLQNRPMSSTSNRITLTVYMAAKTGTENQSSKSSKSIQQTKYLLGNDRIHQSRFKNIIDDIILLLKLFCNRLCRTSH